MSQMGDFNAVPGSALYNFVSRGQLDLMWEDRRHLSGQVEGFGYREHRAALMQGRVKQPYYNPAPALPAPPPHAHPCPRQLTSS